MSSIPETTRKKFKKRSRIKQNEYHNIRFVNLQTVGDLGQKSFSGEVGTEDRLDWVEW